MKKFIFAIALCLFSFGSILAQNNAALHVDKSFYVTGEDIWYKLYLPVGLEKSIAIKGIVVSPGGAVLERFFLRSNPEEPYVDGMFKIPFSYRSGMHRLAFLASAQPDQPPVELVRIDLPIYNDFEIKSLAEKLQNEAAPQTLSGTALELGDLRVNISLNKNEYSKREAVEADISVTDVNGNPVTASLSVVARDADLLEEALPNAPTFALGQDISATQLTQLSDQIFVKGQVTDTLDNPVQANVLGGYTSLQQRIFYGKTNPRGVFTFPLPDFYGNQTLQFIGYPKETEEIRVQLATEVADGDRPKGKLPINDQILKYLESAQQKKKMAEYFEYLDENQEVEKVNNDFEGLEADFTYTADEYVKFETVGDFFSELITPLKFRIVNGVYEARMDNPRSRDASFATLPGKPLFIIDGKITRNADFIARTSWSNVRSVDIFYFAEKLRKQFNILAQGGVVRIETKIPQFTLPPNELEDVFTISGLTPSVDFVPYQPGNSAAEIRLPSFLMPTFWTPDARTDASGKAEVQFYQGDDESTFTLEVVAQDVDGRKGKATVTYTVQ